MISMAGLERSDNYRRDLEERARKLMEKTPYLSLRQLTNGIILENGHKTSYCTVSYIYKKLREEFVTCPQ